MKKETQNRLEKEKQNRGSKKGEIEGNLKPRKDIKEVKIKI